MGAFFVAGPPQNKNAPSGGSKPKAQRGGIIRRPAALEGSRGGLGHETAKQVPVVIDQQTDNRCHRRYESAE
ncbi:hypothetical protein GCM10027288_29650 [Bordetella tumbae]